MGNTFLSYLSFPLKLDKIEIAFWLHACLHANLNQNNVIFNGKVKDQLGNTPRPLDDKTPLICKSHYYGYYS